MTFLLNILQKHEESEKKAFRVKYKTQLIHRDIHPDNMIFEKNNVIFSEENIELLFSKTWSDIKTDIEFEDITKLVENNMEPIIYNSDSSSPVDSIVV